ncbi:hypothetical protein ACQP1O_42840 (plasmid) [Nocardia sp. CA-151230]|uniref:hypothetical protein n=1 Tax=Nocardia sp. CA-151230 TaxID=3239982 RepID=UPI003D91F087
MNSPDLRSTVCAARQLLFTALMLSAGVMAVAWAWVSLGWISIDQFIGMLLGGVVVLTSGLVTAVLQVAWFYLTWPRRNRRMRSYLMYVTRTSRTGSLGGCPSPAAEGGASPVDAAGVVPAALPGASTDVPNLDTYRGRR